MRINTEYRGGILFVRLTGQLTINTVNKLRKKVTVVVGNNGIRNIVFNVSRISKIDYKGIHSLLYIYELATKNDGRVFMCGVKEKVRRIIKETHLFNYIYEISDELCALRVMKG